MVDDPRSPNDPELSELDDRTRGGQPSPEPAPPTAFDALGPTVLEPGPEEGPPPGSAGATRFGMEANEQRTEILAGGPSSWTGAEDTLHEPTIPPSGAKGSSRASTGRGLRSSKLKAKGPTGRLVEGSTYAGKFELLHEIARGGMGAVYKARQVDLNRIVALKVMLAGAMANDEERSRFIREAEAAGRLKHPNVVPVYDIGEVDGNLYFTQEFVDGAPLSDRKKDLSRAQMLEVMIQVCDGVAYAHQRGIIHRDLKPANVMLGADGVPKIMDFGLAKQVEVTDEKGQPSLVTREGSVMGTPHYMPPEQAEGLVSEIDIRSDVWALGVILYELLVGELPFKGRSLSELMLRIFEEDPRPLRQIDPTIDPDLEAIVLKALEKPQEKRYQTAGAMKVDLERQREGLTVSARRATPVYRLQKWTRRHRRGVAVTALFAAVVAVSGGVAWRSYEAAQRAGEASREERFGAVKNRVAALVSEGAAAEQQAGAFLAAKSDVERRAGEVKPLIRSYGDLLARLADLRSDLAEFAQRSGAVELERQLDAQERVLTPRSRGLTRLGRVHEALEAAGRKANEAGAACEAAIRALAPQRAKAGVGGTLEQELVASQKLLRASRQSGEGPAPGTFGAGFQAAEQSFLSALKAARTEAFAALRDSEASSPEAARATGILAALAKELSRLQARRQGVLGVQIAFDMTAATARLLKRIDGKAQAAQVRLRAARLAQSLVQRGLEANQDDRALPGLRQQANASYARALLDMGAFPVLSGLLEDPSFDLVDATRAALKAEQARAIRGKTVLREKLDALLGGMRQASFAELSRRLQALADLAQETGPYPDLERAREQGGKEVDAAQRERARQDVSGVVAAARKAELLSVGEQLRQLDALAAAWRRAEALVRARKRWLSESVYRDGRATCRLGLASVWRNAAIGCGDAAVARALVLAKKASRGYGTVAGWKPGPELLRKQARQQQAETEALIQRLRGLVASAARREKAPPGMVLIAGSGGVKVSLGDGSPKNPDRKQAIAPFYLALREVTNGEYQAFATSKQFQDPAFWKRLGLGGTKARAPRGWTGGRCPQGQEGLPVTEVSYPEARGYAAFKKQRLPTDAEWAFAARYGPRIEPGTGRPWPWGSTWRPLARVLRAPGSDPGDRTPQGVLDLGGNVSEWVVRASGRGGARGGSYLYPFRRLSRGDHRLAPRPGYRGPQLGLRLAEDAAQ